LQNQIIHTADGSHTILVPEIGEQYHSLNGAVTESKHVFIENGYNFSNAKCPVVLEIGFGTGLNAILTALEAEKHKRVTRYIAVEKYPLQPDLIAHLNYGQLLDSDLFNRIHLSGWGSFEEVTPCFSLLKLEADLTQNQLNLGFPANIIYFDAFGPDKQPEMWQPHIFQEMYKNTAESGVIVTYSAKGQVRRDLSATGFTMERIPGPPGKKEMLRGIKLKH
jgi:tRNA U34 5-methylaminomethyl-2-thiouridine-forming methyltransferase MnmC